MKKTLLATSVLLISQLSFANPIPDGVYKGQGAWKSAFASGTYGTETHIHGNKVISSYSLVDGWQRHWEFETKSINNGFFSVLINGTQVGNGYCLENVALCHYEINFNSVKVEETFMMHHGNLYKYGSKIYNAEYIFWQESLEKANFHHASVK